MGGARWIWFLPLGAMILLVAVQGVRLGAQRANLDESAVIVAYAERYLQDHAAQQGAGTAALTDCAAVPGHDPEVWVIVRCSPVGVEADWAYYVRHDGGLAFTGHDRAARPEA